MLAVELGRAGTNVEIDAAEGLHFGTAPVELPQPGRSNHRAVLHARQSRIAHA